MKELHLVCVLCLTNIIVPSQTIGLAISPHTLGIIRFLHSNANLSRQVIIAQVIQEMSAEIDFTQKEINEFYYLSVECKNNSISKQR